jgi:hypothetical protein
MRQSSQSDPVVFEGCLDSTVRGDGVGEAAVQYV